MPTDKLKNQIHLHLIVFIWGFTAILGALITIHAIPLVWYRVFIASLVLFIFIKWKKGSIKVDNEGLFRFFFGGVLIAVHWATFFHAIKVSNISTTLVTLSTTAIFVAFLDPIFGKRSIQWYEILLASIALVGFVIIFNVDDKYEEGIIYSLISALVLAIFSIFNGNNIKKYRAIHIALYELFFAGIFLTFVLLFRGDFIDSINSIVLFDWLFLIILAVVCTAYPFVVATNLLRKMTPFTIVLTNNLEPVYGIFLAVILFGDKEKMDIPFYIGAFLILSAVIINALYKARTNSNQ